MTDQLTSKPPLATNQTSSPLKTPAGPNPGSLPREQRAKMRLVLLAAVVALFPGLASVPSAALAASLQARSASPPITWERCTAAEFRSLDCGTISVPIDWSSSTGEKVTLGLVRRRADDRERRIGPLMLNNDGGSSATEQLRLGLSVDAFHDTLTSRFDLVALDPRGVGQSSPVRCGRPQRSPGVSYFPRDREAFGALVADNRALYASCRRLSGRLLEHLDLENLARDSDAVRAALGEEQVTWYGILSSTLFGRTYARMFPKRVRAMVLDTALDDSVSPVQALAGEDVRAAVQEHQVTRFAWPFFAEALQAALAGDATALATSPDDTYNPFRVT